MKNGKGVVISARMKKTVVVQMERLVQHPRYKKYIMMRTRVKARDEMGVREGDVVEIVPTRPISKEVRWRVLRIVGRRLAPDAPVELPRKEPVAVAETGEKKA
jgi:small subunit ribosomal protein S17